MAGLEIEKLSVDQMIVILGGHEGYEDLNLGFGGVVAGDLLLHFMEIYGVFFLELVDKVANYSEIATSVKFSSRYFFRLRLPFLRSPSIKELILLAFTLLLNLLKQVRFPSNSFSVCFLSKNYPVSTGSSF